MKHFIRALAVSFLLGGTALAQSPATVTGVGPTDLVPVVPNGTGSVQSRFALASQVSGVPGYHNGGVALTAWTYTFASGQQYFYIKPAGTLATGALTTEPNPGDGQRECFFSTQTQTALTWTANTGQTLDGSVPTAGVANTLQCIQYNAASATWFRIQ